MFCAWVRGSTKTSLWFTVKWLYPASLRQLYALHPSETTVLPCLTCFWRIGMRCWAECWLATLRMGLLLSSLTPSIPNTQDLLLRCLPQLYLNDKISTDIVSFIFSVKCDHIWFKIFCLSFMAKFPLNNENNFMSSSNFQVTSSLHFFYCRFADSTQTKTSLVSVEELPVMLSCSMSTCCNLSPCENLLFKSKHIG